MSEKLPDSLRIGVIYFVKDVKVENESLNMYYENLQAIIKNDGNSGPFFGYPLSDKLSNLFLYIDQTMKGYDSYFIKIKNLKSKKDMIIFGKNHYSSLNMPTKGRLSIMLTKSIDKYEYPATISGEEFPLLDKLLGKAIENGKFKHENNRDVGKYCYFEFEEQYKKIISGKNYFIKMDGNNSFLKIAGKNIIMGRDCYFIKLDGKDIIKNEEDYFIKMDGSDYFLKINKKNIIVNNGNYFINLENDYCFTQKHEDGDFVKIDEKNYFIKMDGKNNIIKKNGDHNLIKISGKDNIIELIDNYDFKPLFKKNEPLLERSELNFDSLWNLHLFSHADIIYSQKFINGKNKDYYEKEFKNWENFDTFQYISLFATSVDMYTQNELQLSHLVVNDRIVFFGKYEGKFDDNQEDSDLNHNVINILLEVSNRIDNVHNNFIKGFERNFVNDLEKKIDDFYKDNGALINDKIMINDELIKNDSLIKYVDVGKCPKTNKNYLDSIKEQSIELASKNEPCDVPPKNIIDVPISLFVVKKDDEIGEKTVVDNSLQKLADAMHCIVQPLMKKYFP